LPLLEDSDYNVKVNNMVEAIRKHKNGSYQGLAIILEGTQEEIHV